MPIEHSRPKTPDEVRRQAVSNSQYVRELTGVPLLPPSFTNLDSLGTMKPQEAKQVFGKKRWDIFTTVLRHDLSGRDLPEDQEWQMGQTLQLLNNIDGYIADYYQNPEKRVLYPKQMEAFEALGEFLRDGGTEGYLKLPTAFGKTVVFSELIKAAKTKTLVVVPTIDLIEQTEDRIEQFSPDTPVGTVYSKSKDFGEQVTVITYNSLIKWVEERVPPEEAVNFQPSDYNLVVLDEAHHAIGEQTQEALKAFPDAIKLGFTATPVLGDERHLNEVLEHEIYSKSIKDAVEDGILAPFRVWLAETDLDLSNIDISKRTGEYGQRALALALNTPELSQKIVDLYANNFAGDQGLAFCASVKHAKDLAEFLKANGIKAEAMYGGMDPKKREEYQEAFKRGELDVLTTKQLLTEGVDYPNASFVLNIAPTFSPKEEEQRGGRGERINPANPDKETTIVDFIYKDSRYAMSVTFAEVAETARARRRETTETFDKTKRQIKTEADIEKPLIPVQGLKITTNIEEIMRMGSEATKGRRPDALADGFSRVYTSALGNEYDIKSETVRRLMLKIQRQNPEDILAVGALRSMYFMTEKGEELLRTELAVFNPPEGYSVFAPGALSKELQVNKVTILSHLNSLAEKHPQHFIKRGKGRDIFITDEGLALLKADLPKGARVVKEGYMDLKGTGLAEKFGAATLHRVVTRVSEAHSGEVVRQGKNRPIMITRRGVKFLLKELQESAQQPTGFIIFDISSLVAEYGISKSGVQKYFYDLSAQYPQHFLKRGKNKPLVMSEQGQQILQETMDAALKPPAGYERVDTGVLAEEYGLDRQSVTHQMSRVTKALPEEFKQNPRNKRIDLTPTGMAVLRDNLERRKQEIQKASGEGSISFSSQSSVLEIKVPAPFRLPDASVHTISSSVEYGSEKWKANAARFLVGMRDQAGLASAQVAERMNCEITDVLRLEKGELFLEEMQGDLPKRYAEAIGRPGVYSLYNLMFHLEYGVELPQAA